MDRYKYILNSVQSDIIDNESSIVENEEHKQELYEMSLSSLKAIKAHVSCILNAIEENNPDIKENLTEPWLQGKIAITEDYVRNIHDFLMFTEESDDTAVSGSRPGLWDNIRKKKQREGKKYHPAKPGDKDRPDPQQWNKLTNSEKKKKKLVPPIALPQNTTPPSHDPTTSPVVTPPAE